MSTKDKNKKSTSTEIKIPEIGESIQEVQIAQWFKEEGDTVKQDEPLAELESEKASLDLPAPVTGTLKKILVPAGETVSVGATVGEIEAGQSDSNEKSKTKKQSKAKQKGKRESKQPEEQQESNGRAKNKQKPQHKSKAKEQSEIAEEEEATGFRAEEVAEIDIPATPSARRELRKHGFKATDVSPQGDRIEAEDVRRYVRQEHDAPPATDNDTAGDASESDLERVVPMSFIRRRIAQRLVEAQQKGALLTTYNEIDMTTVIELRSEFREQFAEEYDVDLGYMPFFVKAAIDALRHFPEINAEVRDESIVYRDYYHIGIAVGGGENLVVPVLRFAERMSFAEIEEAIADFARRAKSKELKPDELQSGTFTITNGGVYGSLLSTPIVNPPQSGVLGMHAIEDRPVARNKQVVIRPMMYAALTYDHRIVDGREAVLFLRRVKQAIEEPARMLMEV